MLAQAEKDAADVRSGRKQLLGDGTLMLTANIDANVIEGQVVDRIESELRLPHVIHISGTTAATESARAEINSAKAVLYAEEQLASDMQQPPSREIEEDWLFAWREYAGRVAAEDLQRLWGSVLAGEVKSPGQYSMRTLEFLKTLSKAEAEAISKLARYSVDGRIARGQEAYLEAQGINFGLLLQMQEMGVVSGVEAVGLNTSYKTITQGKYLRALLSNGKVLLVEHDDPTKTLQLEVYLLTSVGVQILGLGTFEPDLEYLSLVGKQMVAQGFEVKLGDWCQLSETEGEYFNAVRVDG